MTVDFWKLLKPLLNRNMGPLSYISDHFCSKVDCVGTVLEGIVINVFRILLKSPALIVLGRLYCSYNYLTLFLEI